MSRTDRIAELSPKKRALLLARLREREQSQRAEGDRGYPGRPPAGSPRLEPLPRPVGAPEWTYPVSFSQLREWILDRFDPGTAAYNIPMWIDLEGRLDVPALAGALDDLGRRHAALRTGFRAPGQPAREGSVHLSLDGGAGDGLPERRGEPVQTVLPRVRIGLPVIDLSALPEARRSGEAGALELRHAGLAFDLARAPLFRVALLRLGAGSHRLLLSIHHIVSDGWSMGVLFRDLGVLYLGRAGVPPPAAVNLEPILDASPEPSPPALEYGEFAAWQRRRLRDETLERLLAYWRDRLAGAEPVLALPTDRPRIPGRALRASNARFRVPPELAAAVRAVARRHEVSLFMLLLAAFDVLFHRLTGQSDLSVGTFIANRNRAETADVVGFFVNTLVLRVDLDGDPTLGELMRRVRETTLGAYDHQDLPFETLLDALQPPRDPGRTPLFQALCVLQNLPTPEVRTPGLTLRGRSAVGQRANFELSAYLAEGSAGGVDPESIGGVLDYDRDLFDAATIERWGRSLNAVLEAFAHRSGARLGQVSALDAAERQQLVREWGEGPRRKAEEGEGADEETVVGLLAARALRDPEAPALESAAGEAISYGELTARVAALARGLRRLGVSPGDVVGVVAPSGPEAVVGFLGVLAAGAAYLPLDPGYPVERLAWMVEDAGASLVVRGGAGDGGAVPVDLGVPVVGPADLLVGGDSQGGTPGPKAAPPPEALAYVLYTSGSTGTPKGVEVSHRSLAGYARTAAAGYRLAPGDRVLQFATLSFDASAEEIYPCLAAGATLVFRDAAAPPAPSGLMEIVERRGITVLDLPTAYWHTLVAALAAVPDRDAATGPLPPSLRLVILGGEAALPAAVAAWRRTVGDRARLVNTYGPTEATIVSSWCDLAGRAGPAGPAGPVDGGGTVPIGRPIPGARLVLADRSLSPVPTGAVGELLIGGGGVARGYRGRPGATAERFVPDPFAEGPLAEGPLAAGEGGARLYRSGDLGRWRAAGPAIEFVGRLDDQVKVRGYRIEPGEVEAALTALPGVREAAVVARREASGAHRLVAYVVVQDGVDAPAPREALAGRLPPHMVPTAFVTLPALPLSPQGKVDRKRLPEPGAAGVVGAGADAAGAPYAAPRTPTERALAEIWSEVLGIERAGVHDNFFDLGGDSLLLLQVHERITREGGPARRTVGEGVAVQVIDLFRHPTIETLAARLAPDRAPESPVEAVAERAARQRDVVRSRAAAVRRNPRGRPAGRAPSSNPSKDPT